MSRIFIFFVTMGRMGQCLILQSIDIERSALFLGHPVYSIRYWIHFEILSLALPCINNLAPSYLQELRSNIISAKTLDLSPSPCSFSPRIVLLGRFMVLVCEIILIIGS